MTQCVVGFHLTEGGYLRCKRYPMANADKILLIGKDPSENFAIQAIIKSNADWKHVLIDTVLSFEQAIKELSVMTYGLVLIDCESFEDSPLEYLIRLRVFTREPILILNEPGLEKTAISCLRNGANYYLIKDEHWVDDLPTIMESIIEEHHQNGRLQSKISKLERENLELKKSKVLDDTTRFYTADHFDTLLTRELKRASRHDFDLTCLVMDVIPKHQTADGLQEGVGTALKAAVRSCDVWARLDSNRFAALLPYTSGKEAKIAIKRIGSEVEGSALFADKPFELRWGVAKYDKKIHDEKELLRRAISAIK